MENSSKNFFKDFYESRTGLWRSIGFLMIEAIIPGILVWTFFGSDFNVTIVINKLPSPVALYSFLICLVYIFLSFVITLIFYICKCHKSDNFTFSIITSLVFTTLTLLSFGFGNNITFIFLRFIIVLAIIVLGGIPGVFLTVWINNFNYYDEEFGPIFETKKSLGETLNKNEEKILKKYHENIAKKNEQEKKSQLIRDRLNAKVDEILKEEEK